MIKKLCEHQEPDFLAIKSTIIVDSWSACLQTLEGNGGAVNAVAVSHDSTQLASGSHDGIVRIWNSGSGECLQKLNEGTNEPITSVAFSHDSTQVAFG